jgi:hypothetical protein
MPRQTGHYLTEPSQTLDASNANPASRVVPAAVAAEATEVELEDSLRELLEDHSSAEDGSAEDHSAVLAAIASAAYRGELQLVLEDYRAAILANEDLEAAWRKRDLHLLSLEG